MEIILPPCTPPFQLTRDKRTLEDKLQDMQQALDSEENKSKQEHRQRLKLESNIQDLDEKLDRESKVYTPSESEALRHELCTFSSSHFSLIHSPFSPCTVYLLFPFSPSSPFLLLCPSLLYQRRQDLEKEKRKLQSEIAELQEQLAQARQRIEDLEQIKARLEKELSAMTAK